MCRRTKPPESYPAGGFLSEEFSCIVCNPYKAQHYRHFYQNTYHCCKCSPGLKLRRDGIGEALVAEKLVGLVGHGADASGDGEGGEEIQCGSAPTTLPDIPESGRGMRLPQAEP